MTLQIPENNEAKAQFLEYLAELQRRGAIESVSLEFVDGRPSRVSILFREPVPLPDGVRVDPDEDATSEWDEDDKTPTEKPR